MKYKAKRLKDGNYELIGLKTMKNIKDKDVEVVVGKVTINKEQLEEVINKYEEETEFFINQHTEEYKNQRSEQFEELKAELDAINKLN